MTSWPRCSELGHRGWSTRKEIYSFNGWETKEKKKRRPGSHNPHQAPVLSDLATSHWVLGLKGSITPQQIPRGLRRAIELSLEYEGSCVPPIKTESQPRL